jgi:hypothetical protein
VNVLAFPVIVSQGMAGSEGVLYKNFKHRKSL